ncbi:hypothetical protein H6F61_22420 [Cyanobacteria bacterium FACHB-472]|nr:hypothetical protein [Cyanobacteria bacterium FACHB-472]
MENLGGVGYIKSNAVRYSEYRDLSQLSAYLELRDEQLLGALATLSMLSPIVGQIGKVMYDDVETDLSLGQSPVEKCMYDDLEENPSSTPIEGSSRDN